MPLHDKWLGPSALGRSASIRAGIVWASFWASFKDCMLSAFPSTSKNLTGQEFHGTAYHDSEDKTSRYNKQSYGHGRPEQRQSRRASSGGEAFKRSAQALFPATSRRLLFSRYSIFLAVIFTRRSEPFRNSFRRRLGLSQRARWLQFQHWSEGLCAEDLLALAGGGHRFLQPSQECRGGVAQFRCPREM